MSETFMEGSFSNDDSLREVFETLSDGSGTISLESLLELARQHDGKFSRKESVSVTEVTLDTAIRAQCGHLDPNAKLSFDDFKAIFASVMASGIN
jgi:Ca2+-binding EF-hand superfamily protein